VRIDYHLQLQLEVVVAGGLWQRRVCWYWQRPTSVIAKGRPVHNIGWRHRPYCEHIIAGLYIPITWIAASRGIRNTGVGEELPDCRGMEGPTVLEPTLVHHDNGVCVTEEFDLERVKSCQVKQTWQSEETENMQQRPT
jgi:hypothetical protein